MYDNENISMGFIIQWDPYLEIQDGSLHLTPLAEAHKVSKHVLDVLQKQLHPTLNQR